jgi:hypothetical protein
MENSELSRMEHPRKNEIDRYWELIRKEVEKGIKYRILDG